jgi:LDH2 family malate/lactate/ureidoglycolate dehydrogenase
MMEVAVGALASWTADVLERAGAPSDVAMVVAEHLVTANRSGHDSHGVQRLPGYLAEIDRGGVDPAARPVVLRERGGTLLVDARRGLGAYTTAWTCRRVADLAATHGVAMATVRQSAHIGRLGHYAEMLAGRGLVSLTTVGMAGDGVGATVVPGTARRFLGANPVAFGIPTDDDPVVVDVSTATVAEGKIQVALARGDQVAPGILVDARGNPTTSPEDYFAGGGLLPLGGTTSGYKGFGLGLVAALLGSLAVIDDPSPTMIGATVREDGDPVGRTAGVAVLAVDPAAFGPAADYVAAAGRTVGALRRVGGVVPGSPEGQARAERSAYVSLPDATWRALAQAARAVGASEFPGAS